MTSMFERGTAKESLASPRRGWVIGHFMDEGTLGHTLSLEVRTWEHKPGVPYGKKEFVGPEYIEVFIGRLELVLSKDGESSREIISAGEYILLSGGVEKEVIAHEYSRGTTVRWPSIPDANKIKVAPR